MLIQELLKIAASLVGGLVLGLLMDLRGGDLAMVPLYVLGIVYGFKMVFPWIMQALRGLLQGVFSSILMRSLLGFIVILIVAPLVLAVLFSVGWIVGICNVVLSLIRAIQQDRTSGRSVRNPGRSFLDLFKRRGRPLPQPSQRGSDPFDSRDPFGDDDFFTDD